MCVCVYIYTYIYTHTYRERGKEGEREREILKYKFSRVLPDYFSGSLLQQSKHLSLITFLYLVVLPDLMLKLVEILTIIETTGIMCPFKCL